MKVLVMSLDDLINHGWYYDEGAIIDPTNDCYMCEAEFRDCCGKELTISEYGNNRYYEFGAHTIPRTACIILEK